MLNILLTDNDAWIKQGILNYFSGRRVAVYDVQSTSELFMLAETLPKAVIISELLLFENNLEDSLNTLMSLRTRYPAARLILLTDIPDRAIINYVTAQIPKVPVIDKKDSVICIADAIFALPRTSDISSSKKLTLTQREFALMRWLTMGKSVTEISYALQLSKKTVSAYKISLARKLGCNNLKELIFCLSRYGYRLGTPPLRTP